ncbi:MAG: 50S ribosomal protein L11 methyltransferase [Clostridiales bacterium]|nr:50S ribosomal protein L11 methyltransferase [Clostridiales bacterium]
MQWVEITIVTTEDASDAICEMLAQIGADGIAVCDPYEIKRIIDDPDSLAYADDGYIDSLGTDVTINAYFAEFDDGIRLGAKNEEYDNPEGVGMIYQNIGTKTVPTEDAMQLIKDRLSDIGQFLDIGQGFTGYKYVKDEDWANKWKADYKSFRISDRIVICPSWEEVEVDPDTKVVYLDPGSAFGTGTHETTSMCAELLDKELKPDDKLLDLGTGSGILAIIAAKLGCKNIEAIDIDRLAVDVAKDNCENNDCGFIDCYTGELKDAKSDKYDVIVANIIADVICAIAGDVPGKLKDDGFFLCSGIINTKAERVENALKEAGFTICETCSKNDWMAYICRKA